MPPITATITEDCRPPVLSLATKPNFRWFAVYTSSRHEKRVAKQLSDRDIENFLPLIEKQHRWAKRSLIRLALPLFPNYLFVHIALQQRVAVLNMPGVLGIVGHGHIPSPLPEVEIERLRAGVELGRVEPHPYPATGERVRITAGPMAGMEGILLRQKNELRLVVTLDLIQRSVAVEIDAEDVEPVLSRRI
jgi:transcription antitermination factor NusG